MGFRFDGLINLPFRLIQGAFGCFPQQMTTSIFDHFYSRTLDFIIAIIFPITRQWNKLIQLNLFYRVLTILITIIQFTSTLTFHFNSILKPFKFLFLLHQPHISIIVDLRILQILLINSRTLYFNPFKFITKIYFTTFRPLFTFLLFLFLTLDLLRFLTFSFLLLLRNIVDLLYIDIFFLSFIDNRIQLYRIMMILAL